MIEVQAAASIDRPPVEVFDYLAELSNNAAWQAGVTRCLQTSRPPIGQGSTFVQESLWAGQRVTTPFEVIEFEPDYRIRTKTTRGSTVVDVIREVSRRADGGSNVRSTVRCEPQGWFMVFAFAARWGLRATVRGDSRRLKHELESASPQLD